VFLAAITPADASHVPGLAWERRAAGLGVESAPARLVVGKQLTLADARSAGGGVVGGPAHRARGEVMVKDLRGKAQESVARNAVRDRVAGLIGHVVL
jgi:histidyl-tRNA synthetase